MNAAPVLRLVSATVGPVPVTAGGPPAVQVVEAYNTGDGALSLSLSSSVTWIAPTAGASRACAKTTAAASCTPLQLALNTASLAAGTHTGIVTVSDPNAIDAPQTITVTVRLGGIDLYVAPDMAREAAVAIGSFANVQPATQTGGEWLSVSLEGSGSFRFQYPYRIRMRPPAGLAEGSYSGSVAITGAAAASDNVTVPVTMRVTTQPIAQASPEYLNLRLAQGAAAVASAITVGNLGQGSLAVQSVAATGSGISAAKTAAGADVTFDAGSLAPGVYSGSVAITTNAVNATVTVPVRFEVVAKGAPLIYYQGVVDNGTFTPGDPAARGDVMVIKGEQLSFAPLTLGKTPPLDMQVGGATVLVNGSPVPMYYSSYGQLAFQMPFDAALGAARVQVRRDESTSNTVTVEVVDRAPRLLTIGTTGYGAIHNAADYSIPMPANAIPGVLTHPAKPGDYLILYAIGIGPTDPVVATGAAAPAQEPLARVRTEPVVNFGGGIVGVSAVPFYAGLSGGYAGLYQINVQIPENVPRGAVYVSISLPDAVSNGVLVEIQ